MKVRHHFITLFSLSLLWLLSACSSRSVDTVATSCAYPDSPRTPAPAFICDAKIEGYPVTILRSAEPSELSVSDRIQQTFEKQISQWQVSWSQAWFAQPEKQLLAKSLINDYLLEHARVVRTRVSPKSYLWLVIGVPESLESIRQIIETQIADGASNT